MTEFELETLLDRALGKLMRWGLFGALSLVVVIVTAYVTQQARLEAVEKVAAQVPPLQKDVDSLRFEIRILPQRTAELVVRRLQEERRAMAGTPSGPIP